MCPNCPYIDVCYSIIDTLVKRKRNLVGHVMRDNGVMREARERRIVDKGGPGRPCIGMCTEELNI